MSEKSLVVWARVMGFPWWPGRISNKKEETLLKISTNNKNNIPITFFGNICQRGWVNESSIKPFDSESLSSKLIQKKLKSDRNYLDAVCEGIRIEMANGKEFPDDIITMIEEIVGDINWAREDVCLVCKGTEFSGDSLICDRCERGEIHLHCLSKPIIEIPFGDWYCPPCCRELKLPEDYMPPDFVGNSSEIIPEEIEPPSKKTKTKRKARLISNDDESNEIKDELNQLIKSEELNNNNNNNNNNHNHNHNNSTSTSLSVTTSSGKRIAREKNSPNPSTPQIYSSLLSLSSSSSPRYNPSSNREKLPDPQTILESYKIKLHDFCFICRIENNKCSGQLILCDYPECYRAYHTACISGRLQSFKVHNEDNSTSNTWFCPAHFCSICCSLESLKVEVDSYPLDILALSLQSKQVELQQCSTCSFSLCYSCSSIVNVNKGRTSNVRSSHSVGISSGIFKNISTQILKSNEVRSPQYAVMLTQLSKGTSHKKSNNITDDESKVFCCLNCASKEKRIVFARYLEELWMHIGTNKLSEPFLHPLLPFDPPFLTSINNLNNQHNSQNNCNIHDNISPSTLSTFTSTSPLDITINQINHIENNENNYNDVDNEINNTNSNSNDEMKICSPSTSFSTPSPLNHDHDHNSNNNDSNDNDSKNDSNIEEISTMTELKKDYNLSDLQNSVNNFLEDNNHNNNHNHSVSNNEKITKENFNSSNKKLTELIDFYSILLRIRVYFYQTNFELFLSDVKLISNLIEDILQNYCTQINMKYNDIEYQRYVEIITQSFNTVVYHINNISSEKRKKLIEDLSSTSSSSNNNKVVSIDEKLSKIWRRECNMTLNDIYNLYLSENYFEQLHQHHPLVISRSIQSWCDHLSRSHLSHPYSLQKERDCYINQLTSEAVDTLLNLNSSSTTTTTTTSSSSLFQTSLPNECSSINLWEDENRIIPTSYYRQSSFGFYGKSVDILNRLHEITTTSLHLQKYLKYELKLNELQSMTTTNINGDTNNSSTSNSNSNNRNSNDHCYTIGEMNKISELQLINDDLRWKIKQQSLELEKSNQLIQKLLDENKKLNESKNQS